MAADTALKLVLLGEDRSASKALKGVGREATQTHGKLDRLKGMGKIAGAAIAGGLVVAAGAAVNFGTDSLKAFADADKSQKQLEDAYRRFPKVANVNIETLRKYNQELQRKTGADADDLAAAQAQLAAFKLNGKQIQSMSPLLIDYANKTGKSLPDAAKLLGKATLGNTRALKDLGISYKSTGDPAKDYANIMTLLKEKVGGYTESLPEVETKQKILQASFGDLQEAVGEKLQPVMLGLIDAGQGVMDWLEANPKVTEGASAAFSLLGTVLGGIWDVVRKYILPGLGWLVEAEANVIRGTADMVDGLNQVPVIGDLIPDDAGDKLRDMADGATAVADGLKSMGEDPPVVEVDTKKFESETKKIDDKIGKLEKKKVKLQSEGDTKGVDKIEAQIKKLKEKKHQVNIGVGLTPKGKQKVTTVRGAGGSISTRFTASGHPSIPSGGLTILGDGMGHSPEAVALPTGSRVFSYGQTAAMANQAKSSRSAAGTVIENHFHVGPGADLRALAQVVDKAMKQEKRARGGRPYDWT